MVGLCISGGGAKIGFAIGVLETMESERIKPDLVCEISSGSLCTAALCYGTVGFLKKQLLEIRKKECMSSNDSDTPLSDDFASSCYT